MKRISDYTKRFGKRLGAMKKPTMPKMPKIIAYGSWPTKHPQEKLEKPRGEG